MNTDDTVLIVDDDVETEPVVIIDEDDENTNSEKTVVVPSAPTVEIIDLDVETPIITGVQTVKNNATICVKKSERAFVNNLKNNRLMDKIVTRCINMENATGMPRVVYKTLLPLYKETSNRFKHSEEFRTLLKRTYKLLMRDPDHKFLHIKTLCEELKSGGLRRKVPFVTLATNLKNNSSQGRNEELISRSREISHSNAGNIQIHQVKAKTQYMKRKRVRVSGTKNKAKQVKHLNNKERKKIETESVPNAEKAKTYIIDLDDSETEAASSPINADEQNDHIQNDNGQNDDIQNDNEENDDIQNDNEENDDIQNDEENDDGHNDVIIIEETEPSDQRNDNVNTGQQETLEDDSNKENNHKNGQPLENEMDYDLLIPTNVCNAVKPTNVCNAVIPTNVYNAVIPTDVCKVELEISHYERFVQPCRHSIQANKGIIKRLEMQIADDKKMIDKLEEQEVSFEDPDSSPYYLCSKYKEDIVKCYKQLCELKGESKDIEKRREIRLLVADGHAPGPAKRLEQFLNSTIDTTGSVEFPNFADVVKCVVESNIYDKLAWNRQQVIHEAVGLFRQCGQALRKQRQKREYRDLLSLIRNKKEIDDPAEKDTVLLAKLEENKLIAKKREEEILDRFVRMEKDAKTARFGNPHEVGNTAEFESDQDSSDSESESEQNITIPYNITTSTVNNQPVTGECSRSNFSLSAEQSNNVILTSAPINDHCNVTQSSNTDQMVVNNFVVPSTAVPSTLNPMLMNLLFIPATPLYLVPNTITNQNQSAIRESSIMNESVTNNNLLDIQITNTISLSAATTHDDRETMECSDREDRTNCIIGSSLSETAVSVLNRNSEISLMNNIEHTKCEVNEPCNITSVQENVCGTTDTVEQNCDSSNEDNIEDIVKSEPLDIQSMLDELGNGFVCQVFDIEDPFLVIEISSDDYSDDED